MFDSAVGSQTLESSLKHKREEQEPLAVCRERRRRDPGDSRCLPLKECSPLKGKRSLLAPRICLL